MQVPSLRYNADVSDKRVQIQTMIRLLLLESLALWSVVQHEYLFSRNAVLDKDEPAVQFIFPSYWYMMVQATVV